MPYALRLYNSLVSKVEPKKESRLEGRAMLARLLRRLAHLTQAVILERAARWSSSDGARVATRNHRVVSKEMGMIATLTINCRELIIDEALCDSNRMMLPSLRSIESAIHFILRLFCWEEMLL